MFCRFLMRKDKILLRKTMKRVREERPGFVPIKKSLISATPSIIWHNGSKILICYVYAYQVIIARKILHCLLRRITHGSHLPIMIKKHIKNVISSQVQMCDTDRRLIFLTIPDKIPTSICQQMEC